MNALLAHRWGVSPAVDRVWAQVVGLPPRRAVGRLVMVLQAFIDESFSTDEFVLAGHIATAENWAALSAEWDLLLPRFGILGNNGKHHFKMSEMAQTAERLERVRPFYKAIEDCVIVSISARINLADFARAQERYELASRQMGWSAPLGMWANPWFFTFRIMLDGFHGNRQNFTSIPSDQKVDFIFDDRAEKTPILQAWNEYLEKSDLKDLFGATPRFENDQDFLPLQAADLWAWWVREWYEEDNSNIPDKMRDLDFGTWKGKKRLKIALTCDEDQIFQILQSIPIELIAEGKYVMHSALGDTHSGASWTPDDS